LLISYFKLNHNLSPTINIHNNIINMKQALTYFFSYLFTSLLLVISYSSSNAQAPIISYTSGNKVYAIGTAISALNPTNTGGACGANVTTLAGSGFDVYADGVGTSASFNHPTGVAVDGNENVYVADSRNNKIRKISPLGVVSTFAGSGFNYPYGVAVDGSGNVYVANTGNNNICKISPSGIVSTFAGNNTYGFADGVGSVASFKYPISVAVDGIGFVYVADWDNNRIRKVSPSGVVSTLAGNGSYSFADGVGTVASFSRPEGIAVDGSGNVYLADTYNQRVRKVTTSGVVSTLAGSGTYGFVNGVATAARFTFPRGIALDGNGNLYVVDTAAIRKISPTGLVSTFAGSDTLGYADGVGSTARFRHPSGVALDGNGNIYVADEGNNRIRKISILGIFTINPALPAGLAIDANTGIISGTPSVATSATNYVVTAGNGSGSSSFTINLATVISSLLNITANGSTTFFVGGSVLLSASQGIGFTYQWSKDGSPIANANSATYTAKETGSYTVTITAKNVSATSTAISVNAIYTLPANNFKITNTNQTCQNSNNGKIGISALQAKAYSAQLVGNGIDVTKPFTSNVDFQGLQAGKYTVCITVSGQTDYSQCFDATIGQPQDLAVYALLSTDNKVTLNLSGSDVYDIELNGIKQQTTDDHISLGLQPGENILKVSTGKYCQGVIEKRFTVNQNGIVYPNPFDRTLNLYNLPIGTTVIEVQNLDGKVVYKKTYANKLGTLSIELNQLNAGIYILKTTTNNSVSIFKIIKK
jgi:sugar lactone lactonase YvrE